MGDQHFVDLFKDERCTNIEDQLKVIQIFHSFIHENDRDGFLVSTTMDEVQDVIKGFKKDKSPGPDGWHVEFFLNFFELVGADLLGAVEQSRLGGKVSGALHATFITLIPKRDKPCTIVDFRPIYL